MNRFEALVSLAGRNKILADIGCDHGRVSAYIAKNKLAEKVWASDISAPSLAKARKLAENLKLDNIEFFLSDGFASFPQKPDTAIIAGMGADVIIKIIGHGLAKTHLVLQPMKDYDVLVKWVEDNGFFIEKAVIAKEGRRFYPVFSVLFGTGEKFKTENFGENATEFVEHEIKVLSRALAGALKSNERSSANEIEIKINELRGVAECLKSKT